MSNPQRSLLALFSGVVMLIPSTYAFADTNAAPVLESIGSQVVNENQVDVITLHATDINENDVLTYTAANLPAGATFDPEFHQFLWRPTPGQAGVYEVSFTVADNGDPSLSASEVVTITVNPANRPPVFTQIDPQQVLEHTLLTFAVNVTDPDGNALRVSASNLPTGAVYDATARTFSWTPTHPEEGTYSVTFFARDNGIPSTNARMTVVITVINNPTPVERLQELTAAVSSANIATTSVEQSLSANLKKVDTFIQAGKYTPAINQLYAFVQKADQDYAKGKLAFPLWNDFVSRAKVLIAALQSL